MAEYDIRHSITRAPALVIYALIALMAALPAQAGSDVVSGPATVIDGQTMEIAGQRFSLHAIAAPHLEQTCEWPDQTIPCGDVSRTALMDLVIAATVNCQAVDAAGKLDGSTVARCDVDGFDVGRNMVHTGWAVADPRVSDIYADTEVTARNARRGLWKGTFEMPWNWHAND